MHQNKCCSSGVLRDCCNSIIYRDCSNSNHLGLRTERFQSLVVNLKVYDESSSYLTIEKDTVTIVFPLGIASLSSYLLQFRNYSLTEQESLIGLTVHDILVEFLRLLVRG